MPTVINNSIDTTRQVDGTKMQLESLELAGCTLDRYISADNSRPSFLEITGIASHRSPTCSGLNAGDYRNLAALVNHPSLSQLKILNKVPLPPEIMEHFAHMQCHCLMGVFPEISRVWLAIDSNIYVWAFEHGSDVAYFDGLGETIVSVGLVKPKSGVFQNFVKYLLVLTTTVEIVVLVKMMVLEKFQEIHLVPEPVFVLPTDGISMMCVKSTDKGRIFMGGKDGCLYEITYQAQLGWFGKHCKKVNHSTSTLSFLVPTFLSAALYDEDPIVKIEVDNSRNILYTLSEKGCIEVFDLGPDGEGLSRVVRLTQGKIVSSAFDIVKTLEPNNFKPVVAISAVEESESDHLNLVAVTQTGARLYFSTGSSDATPGGSQRPQYLTLLHVRLPPGFTPNSSVLKPKQVHSAVYENGSLVMVCSAGGGGEAETLWCLSRVLASTSTFSESHTLLALDGPAWALTALPHHHSKHLSQALLSKKEVWSVSRWAVVTGAGACVVEAGAAPDLLRALLRDCRGPDAHPVKDFFQLYSVEQACACALYLACEDITSGDLSISEWATRAFFLYGSQLAPSPMYQQPSQMPTTIGSPKFSPRQMSTPMSIRGPQGQLQPGKLNQSYQGPMNQSFPGSPNQSMMPQSPFHQSMMSPGFNQSSFVGNMTQQPRDPNFPMPIEYSAKHNGLYIYIGRILAPIWGLKCVTMSQSPDKKEFMSSKVTGEDCAYIVQKLQRVAAFMQRTLAPPHSDEHASLQALKLFITMAIEMLSLWKVLCEHQFHVIAASLPPEQQNALQAASYRELLVGGQEVACLLLGSLVAGYLRDNASVDGISQKLRQLCPTLYRQEDATCSKANELLIFAKQQKNPAEREEMLQHALKLCKDVAPNVNLPLVCSKLVSAGFYSGVVELCVACASKLDPQDKAVHYYKSDQPSQDREGHFIYYRRMEIYREVCSALERLYERSAEASSSEPSPLRSQPNNDNILTMSPADANYQKDLNDFNLSILYREGSWYGNVSPEMMNFCTSLFMSGLVSKHLGSELLSLGTAPPASLRTYLQAAARSAAPSAALHLLDLLWKVLEKSGDHLAAANLYEEYADRYNLWECKLAIVQCSGHNDALLVENIWSNILAEAEAAARNLPTPDEKLASVLSKLTSLGREYVNTGHCFPLYFIVRQLEIMSCKLQADRGMVFKTILNIGVSLEQVLDIYIKLVSVNERVWLGSGDESH
ncbi:hypothetical protein HW555_010090, partial [Spodoptera exigua]